jgi:tetratricopeptide (TPR) repeat protein
VLLYTRPITIIPNKGTEIAVPLDLPSEMLSTDERLDRKSKSLPDVTLQSLQDRVGIRELDLAGLDYAVMGFDYLTTGDYPRAVEYYRKATEAFPDISEIWYNYACALSRNNNINEGLAALRKVVELGYENIAWILRDPDLENLRKDDRFKGLVKN